MIVTMSDAFFPNRLIACLNGSSVDGVWVTGLGALAVSGSGLRFANAGSLDAALKAISGLTSFAAGFEVVSVEVGGLIFRFFRLSA